MGKVLIVDDNQKNVEIFKDFVQAWGHECLCAYQGMEAIEVATRERPDVILLDVMLPGMSGFEVAAALRADKQTENISIVMVSALNSAEDRVNGYISGADNFLVKPVNYKELRTLIKNSLTKREMLTRKEDGELVLGKIAYILRDSARKHGLLQQEEELSEEERLKLCEDILKQSSLPRVTAARMLWVMRLQFLYKQTFKSEHLKNLFSELCDGFNFSCWLLPLLDYSCNSYGKRDQQMLAMIHEHELDSTAECCYIATRFADIWLNNKGDYKNILLEFDKERKLYGYDAYFSDILKKITKTAELKAKLNLVIL